MDPTVYRSWSAEFKDHVPALSPIPGGPVHRDEPMEESDKSTPSDTSWTVYSPNVTRGNFNKEKDNDPRMTAGWHSPGKEHSVKNQKKSMPWMAPGEAWPQPPVWEGAKDNEM
jgi:hypothetical protein